MTRLKIAAGAALLASLACAARAQEPGADHRPPRGAGDRQEIFLSPAGEPFRAPGGAPYPITTWFEQVDANHDGQISREEFRADFARFFLLLDENHDGVIDGFEVEDYERKIAPEVLSVLERAGAPSRDGEEGPTGGMGGGLGGGDGGGRRGRGGEGGGPGGGGPGGGRGGGKPSAGATAVARLQVQGAGAYSLLSISEPVAAADVQVDGRITPVEFRAAADRRFDLLDVKHLGYLTLVDLPKTPAQLAEVKLAKEKKSGAPNGGSGPGAGRPDGPGDQQGAQGVDPPLPPP